jgi:hypothetical protein
MSRTWKPWQPTPYRERRIVETLKRVRSFYLADLAPGAAADELGKVTQAARELEQRGKIALVQIGVELIAFRTTDGIPDPVAVKRLKPTSR